MNILAVDDEEGALDSLVSAICTAEPDAQIQAFQSPGTALDYMEKQTVDVAFLDIQMAAWMASPSLRS